MAVKLTDADKRAINRFLKYVNSVRHSLGLKERKKLQPAIPGSLDTDIVAMNILNQDNFSITPYDHLEFHLSGIVGSEECLEVLEKIGKAWKKKPSKTVEKKNGGSYHSWFLDYPSQISKFVTQFDNLEYPSLVQNSGELIRHSYLLQRELDETHELLRQARIDLASYENLYKAETVIRMLAEEQLKGRKLISLIISRIKGALKRD